MEQAWPHSPTRATLFYTVCLLSLWLFGSALQHLLGLPGFVATQVLFFLGLSLLFSMTVGGPGPRELLRLRPLTLTGTAKSLALGLVGWALAHALSTLALFVVTSLGGKIPELYQMITDAPFLVAILVGALLPAICEEVAFRGYMLWNLNGLGGRAAVWATAVLFGVMHMSLIRVVPLTVLGLLFSAGVQRTGSLLPGMIMHFVHNATALSLTFYFRSTGTAAPSPEPTPASAALLAVAAIVLGALAWALARTFGPGDVSRSLPEAETPVPPALGRERKALSAVFLLPAAAIYIWAVAYELVTVF